MSTQDADLSHELNSHSDSQNQSTHEEDASTASLFRWIEAGLNWMLFFPILLFERFTKYEVSRALAFPLLAVAAILGLYDLLYGSFAYPVYEITIDFSNQSLINSLVVLTTIKAGELVGTFVPGLQAVGEILQQIGDYLANGVLALAIQSAFLVLVKEGLVLRYLLAFGFLLLAVPALYKYGKRLVFGSLILFFVMPPVVSLEAFVYERVTDSIEADLDSNFEQLKESILLGGWGAVESGATAVKESVVEGAVAVKASVFSIADKVSNLMSEETSTEDQDLETLPNAPPLNPEAPEAKADQKGLLTTIGEIAQAMINSLLKLFAITILTCVVAPVVAYFLVFRLLREVFSHDYFEVLPLERSE